MVDFVFKIEIDSQGCCSECSEIVSASFDCPVCLKTNVGIYPYDHLDYYKEIEISCCNCDSKFKKISDSWYYDCQVQLITEEEIFLPIEGYADYEISNLGRVKSLCRIDKVGRNIRERILKPIFDTAGYKRVSLYSDTGMSKIHIHILVCIAFKNHTPNKYTSVVDHIWNNKLDNRDSFLKIVSHRLNTSKDQKNKTSKYTGVCWDKSMNKWKSGIRIKQKITHLGYFDNELDARNAYIKKLNSI